MPFIYGSYAVAARISGDMHRATALATIGALAASGMFPVRARAATTAIRMGTGLTDSGILVSVAQSFGYLDRAGVSVDLQIISNGAATMAALLGGAIDIGGSNSLSFLQARDKGLPLKIVAAQAVYRAGEASTALVVSTSSSVRSARDLSGKIVAVNALGGSPHIAVQMWIDKNGGDSKAVRFTEMAFPAMPAALAANRADAAMIAEPALTAALEQGRILGDAYGALGRLWLSDAIIATESWLAANADEAKRFAQALHAAGTWANHNRDKTAPISAKLLNIDPAVVRTMRRAVFSEHTTPALIQPVIDAGTTYHALTTPLVAADAFSPNALI
jgi:NitT/TauT family transport system substrate-binding protein